MEFTKIGYDAKRAVSNMTGLGNYSRLVIETIAEACPEMEIELFAPKMGENPRLSKIRGCANVSWRTPRRGEARLGRSHWRSFGVGRILGSEGVELYHGLSNELPLNIGGSGVVSVLTMHDVIYRRLPYCYSPLDRRIYDFKYGRSCRAATRIVAVSECTKRDVMHYYGIGEEKIDVVYQGCDAQFYARRDDNKISEIKHKYSLPGTYLLQVGSIERRKNALRTVQALSALPRDVHLVLVGRGTGYLKEVLREAEKLGVRERVKVLSGLPFAELPYLYQGAAASVYPSYYEGFGIPVLESLASGTPCVAATGSCLEEAGGAGALYVDPEDGRGLAEAVGGLCGRGPLSDRLRGEGCRHAARFTRETLAEGLLASYRRAVNHKI